MRRRIGDVLIADFGWTDIRIAEAVAAQSSSQGAHRLGWYLRTLTPASERHSVHEVAMALLLQRSERRPADQAASEADRLEYQDLGNLHRFERTQMGRHTNFYGGVLMGVFVIGGLPLVQGIVILGRDRAVAVLYGILGLVCTTLLAFCGDHLIRRYAEYQKRRMRIAVSRAAIRCHWILDGATPTAMPTRRALTESRPEDSSERADPELRSTQWNLPVWYTLWTMLVAGGMAVFFIATIVAATGKVVSSGTTASTATKAVSSGISPGTVARDVSIDTAATTVAVGVMVVISALWIWALSVMWIRYVCTLREAELLHASRPFPIIVESPRHAALIKRRWSFNTHATISFLGLIVISTYSYLHATDADGETQWGVVLVIYAVLVLVGANAWVGQMLTRTARLRTRAVRN